MNKLTSIGIIVFILTFHNQMFSQSKADFQQVEKITVNATVPTISPDHNAAKVPTQEQQIKIDFKNQLAQAKADLAKMVKINNVNPTAAGTNDIEEVNLLIGKLEKALGIN